MAKREKIMKHIGPLFTKVKPNLTAYKCFCNHSNMIFVIYIYKQEEEKLKRLLLSTFA